MRVQDLHKRIAQEPNTGCWIWTGGTSRGYGLIRVKGGKALRAHRVLWELHHGPIPDGLSVLHKCDTPLCVNPQHLFLGTQADNLADASMKGRIARGQRAHFTKLTDEQVAEIRRCLSEGTPIKEIGRRFQIDPHTVRSLRDGLSWSWLKEGTRA